MKTITTNGGMQSGGGGLSPKQQQLLSHFNQMDEETQQSLIYMACGLAADFPRQRPKLRVVGGRAA